MSRPRETERPGPIGWATLVLICGSAVLSGLLELLLVPLYIGSWVIPVAVLAAAVGNVVLPVWAYRVVGTGRAAVAPVLLWLITVLVLSMASRPEGDLFVLGQYGEQYNFYALLFVGATVGLGAVIRVTTPKRPPPGPPPRPTPDGRPRVTKG